MTNVSDLPSELSNAAASAFDRRIALFATAVERGIAIGSSGGAEHSAAPPDQRPLANLLIAGKDNVDVAGYPTTARCPEFTYWPAQSANVAHHIGWRNRPMWCSAYSMPVQARSEKPIKAFYAKRQRCPAPPISRLAAAGVLI